MPKPDHTARWSSPSAGGIVLVLAGLGGLIVWVLSFTMYEPERVWYALLTSFVYFTPMAAGLAVWPAIVKASRGNWPGKLEYLASAANGFAIPSMIALAVLWAGSGSWAPWYGKELPQGAWLDNTFLFVRDLCALALFWILSFIYLRRLRKGEGEIAGPFLILTYCVVFSLLGMDLTMSLDPYWHSSLYPGYFFISGLYIAAAAWAFLSSQQPDARKSQLHDLGKLTLAFSMLTTYLFFAQLLPIWYENLGPEIRFVLPRMHGDPWRGFSAALLATVYLGPLGFLLKKRVKTHRPYLAAATAVILVFMWIERWWLVTPTVSSAFRLGVPEMSIAASLAGALGLSLRWFRGRAEYPLKGAVP